MQTISYAMVTNILRRARGRPKGFIPDEALDRDRALLQDTALKDAGLGKSTPETLTMACHAASWLA